MATLSQFKALYCSGVFIDSLGTLIAREEKTIKRSGQGMAMNNSGDTIELLDDDGTVIATVTYDRVDEGEEVFR